MFCLRVVSYSSGWPWIHYIAQDDLKLLILQPPPTKWRIACMKSPCLNSFSFLLYRKPIIKTQDYTASCSTLCFMQQSPSSSTSIFRISVTLESKKVDLCYFQASSELHSEALSAKIFPQYNDDLGQFETEAPYFIVIFILLLIS